MVSIAMYQPDIPQNLGAMIRLSACMGADLHVIEPTSFPYDERKIRQSAMDYMGKISIHRHASWNAFKDGIKNRRIVLMTTKGACSYPDFEFRSDDILLAGSESAGVPENVHNEVDARIVIPMQNGLRSLNIVNATSMILGEVLRQTDGFAA
ncbi:MAG: tRNA (cytidine(34)-2'-O)-methyltransferase [Alphaproteobacteria bacterium]|nr:tRNA (cytidine(34)-2'-O)-methyltransferase [Alphaproteobacteria bacterium]